MPNFRGRRFTNAHETLIWAAKSATAKSYTFNYKRLKIGNDDCQVRSDWFLPLCTGAERLKNTDGRKLHPTQKPESLLTRILLAASNQEDLVLDPFFGSGTTGAVAKKLRRSFIGIERDAAYIKAARERIDAVAPLPPGALDSVTATPSRPRIPFASLLEAGLMQPGETLFDARKYHTATVQAGGAISTGAATGSNSQNRGTGPKPPRLQRLDILALRAQRPPHADRRTPHAPPREPPASGGMIPGDACAALVGHCAGCGSY